MAVVAMRFHFNEVGANICERDANSTRNYTYQPLLVVRVGREVLKLNNLNTYLSFVDISLKEKSKPAGETPHLKVKSD